VTGVVPPSGGTPLPPPLPPQEVRANRPTSKTPGSNHRFVAAFIAFPPFLKVVGLVDDLDCKNQFQPVVSITQSEGRTYGEELNSGVGNRYFAGSKWLLMAG
jgi:hypothetical protein